MANHHSPIQLVIFDCDGVLVDSEVLGNRVVVEFLAEMGMAMTLQEAVSLFRGCKMANLIAEIERRFDTKLPQTFAKDVRARMAVAFETELEAIDGVADAIEAIHLPTCVASSGPMEKIRLTLGITGLLHHFEGRIFSAYDVGSWKPDPGLFLHAAKMMGVHPANCMVIEDSTLGVQAAVAAGMRVIGYAPDAVQAAALEAAGAKAIGSMSLLEGQLTE